MGCLIYSDPHEDGYFKGDVYPKGGWRPEQGVQRGSVADMQVYPGDPLTPGIGSTPGAKRLALEDAKTILKIPVLPISYGDATPLLKALEGPVAPEELARFVAVDLSRSARVRPRYAWWWSRTGVRRRSTTWSPS